MKRPIVVALLGVLAGPAMADPEFGYSEFAYRDSGIGSYSNAYGHGWTKVCCDYPYFRHSRVWRGQRVRR